MDNMAMLEYYQDKPNDILKLEYLKARVKLSELAQELENIHEEHWRHAKAAEIEKVEHEIEIIDRVWYFRNHEHIPFEGFDR